MLKEILDVGDMVRFIAFPDLRLVAGAFAARVQEQEQSLLSPLAARSYPAIRWCWSMIPRTAC